MFFLPTIFWLGTLKRIEKIIRESSFDNKKKKAVLKFNLGLVLTGIRTTVTVPRSKIGWSYHQIHGP